MPPVGDTMAYWEYGKACQTEPRHVFSSEAWLVTEIVYAEMV